VIVWYPRARNLFTPACLLVTYRNPLILPILRMYMQAVPLVGLGQDWNPTIPN
jgi:hypothetical protein